MKKLWIAFLLSFLMIVPALTGCSDSRIEKLEIAVENSTKENLERDEAMTNLNSKLISVEKKLEIARNNAERALGKAALAKEEAEKANEAAQKAKENAKGWEDFDKMLGQHYAKKLKLRPLK